MAHWSMLDGVERSRLEMLTLELMASKRWEAAHGFELSDEIQVVIAAQASLLLLGLPDDSYREVQAIIVHPTTVVARGERSVVPGLVTDADQPILGQAAMGGPVLIVWDAALEGARHPERGFNVVYHEFAHKLDMLEGSMDGTPPLADAAQFERWVAVCTEVFERVAEGRSGSALRSYAGVNPSEFFAVATEAFFDVPALLLAEEPVLYAVLRDFYRQDPAARQV
jgi:Mlc titration factor MtfA (ptsG expression regulator)